MIQPRTILILLLFSIGIFPRTQAQVGGTFFAVHCDPPNSDDWSSLKEIVDSANLYNVPLTIMMTPPWADSVYNSPVKAAQLANWQEQGHEIAYHHHGINAKNPFSWDGYTNAPNDSIDSAGLDPADKIGDMGDFMEFMLPLTGDVPVTTAGIGTETEWPAGIIYRAEGQNYDRTDVFSIVTPYDHNGFRVCGLTYANLTSATVNYAMAEYESFSSDYYAGLVTHARDFVSDASKQEATMEWFRFISDASNKKTISQIMTESSSCSMPRSPFGKPQFQYDFSVTRNPDALSNTLALRLNGATSQKLFVRIFDQKGKLISVKNIDVLTGMEKIKLSTKKLTAGSYSVEISSDSFKIIESVEIE